VKFTKRHQIILLFLATALAIVWISNPPPQKTEPEILSESLYNLPLVNGAIGQDVTVSGQLGIVYGDASNFESYEAHTFLTEADGDVIELQIPDNMLDSLMNIHEVTVTGTLVDADPTRTNDAPLLDVVRLDVLSGDSVQNGVTGNERWVNVACRFKDIEAMPRDRQYFEDIMLNNEPGMDHYWRQTSTDLVNIEGSTAYGWYSLPQNKDYYLRSANVNVGIALQLLMRDCVQQAQQNDKVDFKQFSGINVMLNDTFGCCAWGGSMALNIDGENVRFRTTWLPPWAFTSLHVIAHEMGHGWGLPHSGGSRNHPRYPYDSAWDIMSGGTWMVEECKKVHTVYDCIQVATIGYHLDMLGWIPQDRIVTVAAGQSETVTLDALTTTSSSNHDLLVRVPIGTSNQFYTVEARNFIGYDTNLPAETVILHTVQPGRSEPAVVVDGDNNGNVNDEGAMWNPGETFVDAQNKIRIEVLSRDGTTFTVRVTNGR
jgi:M6 family metalloprotease-like protein